MNTEEISYEIHMSISFTLKVHKKKKYRKTCACPDPIITATAPAKLFPKGLYSTDFWIQCILNKYAYSIPLNRQIEMMNMHGLEIPASTLTNGIMKIAHFLQPLYELMLHNIALEKLVQADETRWKNWACRYDPERIEVEKALHWLWGFFSERYEVFLINSSRSAQVLRDAFGQGDDQTIIPLFVTDRYKAYIAVCLLLAFCWAHVRRDFLGMQIKYPADKDLFAWCNLWIELIAKLYHFNALRIQHPQDSKPFLSYHHQLEGSLSEMVELMAQSYSHPQKQAQAHSMINHWEGLTLFMEYPEVPLDNNRSERQLRIAALGRKNFYGTHSDQATEATAIFYSILSTCKLHNLHAHKFLKAYLGYCSEYQKPPPKKILRTFLPHHYAKHHPQDLINKR